MSRQNKQRNKRAGRQATKAEARKGHSGASSVPSKQLAPPWVRNGKRVPKIVRDLEAKKREAENAPKKTE